MEGLELDPWQRSSAVAHGLRLLCPSDAFLTTDVAAAGGVVASGREGLLVRDRTPQGRGRSRLVDAVDEEWRTGRAECKSAREHIYN